MMGLVLDDFLHQIDQANRDYHLRRGGGGAKATRRRPAAHGSVVKLDQQWTGEHLGDSSDHSTHTLKVVNQWPLAPCEGPSGVAMDTETRRICIGCHGGGETGGGVMVVFNPDAGKVVATLPIGGAGNDAVRFDPGLKLAFASEGEGDITIVCEDSPDKFTVLGNVKTEMGARTM
jgi:hypothetical protein